jgi:spore maturation protein CgeB
VKTLYVALRYDYGDPSRGDSFEHETFLPVLREFSDELIYFPFDAILADSDYFAMNRRLLSVVDGVGPDLVFFVLFENQIARDTVRRITQATSSKTFNWFCDDHWRYAEYSRHWADCFNAVSTTSRDAYEWYRRDGFDRVIKTQWAVSRDRVLPRVTEEYEGLTFVGQHRKMRGKYVETLNEAGLPIRAYGKGWPAGRLAFEQLVDVNRRSAVNLNFADSHRPVWWKRRLRQVKARPFELAAAGRAVLSERDDEMDEYFVPDKDLLTFRGRRHLVRQAERLLADRDLREELGSSIHQKVIAEHTYTHRMRDIFRRLELPGEPRRGASNGIRVVGIDGITTLPTGGGHADR